MLKVTEWQWISVDTCKELWKCSLPCWEGDGNLADFYSERVEHIVYNRFTDLQTHENMKSSDAKASKLIGN